MIKELCFVVAALSAAVSAASGFFLMPGVGSEDWPTVPGEVISCEVEKVDDGDGYFVRLRYRYGVRSTTHQGFRIRFGSTKYIFRSSAQKECDTYPPGKAVTVYHQPEFPPNSALIPGGSMFGRPLTWGGGILTVLALLASMVATIVETVHARQDRARRYRELGPDPE
ncbi:MAG: DUF3592 domain-containing protein [Alphaproteobacteria bacterium]|nr:DUF3592 domain-containing protein [Alphaproteobacteria bacterium]MCB9692277.1 DUF3592 domain-containing protein [Alphaproteobacteria bacterium]